jgi:hypothetical protein
MKYLVSSIAIMREQGKKKKNLGNNEKKNFRSYFKKISEYFSLPIQTKFIEKFVELML